VVSEGCYAGGIGASAVLAAEGYVHKWLRSYERCVDRYLAPSQFVRKKLVENGFEGARIDVLPHFQELGEGDSPAPESPAPILYFGRLSREKGLVDLLHAAAITPDIPVWIAGDGPQRKELERLGRELGASNVRFLGHVRGAEIDRLIESAMFTVLPSLAYETLGKTILESYARARPVIATDLGSRREFVEPGKTGILYPPGDRQRLADAIRFLYEQPDLAARMGRQGRELVSARHTPESHCRVLERIYGQLIESRSCALAARRPVRVAFIGGRGLVGKYSGIETYYEEVGERLASQGHHITAYCRNYFTPPGREFRGVRVVRLPTIRSKHLETVIHTGLSTVDAMFRGYDIVHYHALGPALFSFLPRLLGKKTIVTVQGLDWQRKKWGHFAAAALRLGEQAAVRLPNSTMVVSRTLQEYFERRYGATTCYVPNGTRVRMPREARHLAEWGLERDSYILFLGRFSPEKNCDLLVQAYSQLSTDTKLVLAGGSSHSDEYANRLRQCASEKIRVLEWVSGEALDELITHAMMFVLPSDLEGLSLALLDAMGAGLCVLTSDVPENREVVDGAGFTFRRGDVMDLTAMLRFLLNNWKARERAGRAARQRIEELYLWPRIAEEIEREYLRVLGWKSSRAECVEPQRSA
jgi:glycosyltransferase involved in cell wall biosynthesis